MKLKKGDNVIVITGKDKGKTGKITRVLTERNRVMVEGINVMKRHQKARTSDSKGQTLSFAMPMHASNVMILDPKGGERTRIGKKKVGDKFVRIARGSKQEI